MTRGERRKQTATSEFGRWFGDSKVVDEVGRPKVMYHGTDAEEEFTRFEFTEDVGFHFGPPETANARLTQIGASEHARIIPVFLSIKNPLRLPDLMTWGPGEVILALGEAGVLSERRTRELLDEGYFDELDFRRALERKRYDGVVYRNSTEGGGDSYIALRPEQIRFAIGGGEHRQRAEDPSFLRSGGEQADPGNVEEVLKYLS
jgi:ADP-Ribosyltransferase in polyvalent proteins